VIDIQQLCNNCTRVAVGNNLTLWFSYKTVVAFRVGPEMVVHENYWSKTTGKHLNLIDGGDKKSRLKPDPFQAKWDELAEPVFEAMNINSLAGGMFNGVETLRRSKRRAIGKLKDARA
jgi:hypothetical protein